MRLFKIATCDDPKLAGPAAKSRKRECKWSTVWQTKILLSGSERRETVGCLKDPFMLCKEYGVLKTMMGTSESYNLTGFGFIYIL